MAQKYFFAIHTLLQRRKIKKAEKFFSKAVQIDPGYKDAINNLLPIKKMFKQDEK